MTPTRKPRWLVVIVAVAVVTGVVGFVVFRGEPKDDVPRLEVIGEGEHFGYNCVAFRFHAPKTRNAVIGASRMWVCSHGLAEAPPNFVTEISDPAIIAGGTFTEFAVPVPSSTNWWLEVETLQEETGVQTQLGRVLNAFRGMTLRHWNSRVFVSHGRIRSEPVTNAVPGFRPNWSLKWKPITNAVPRTGDAPAR